MSWLLSSLRVVPSLLQETLVAGPPVEVQVRVNTGGSVAGSVFNWKVISSGIVTWPVEGKTITRCTAAGMMHNIVCYASVKMSDK